MLRVEKRIPFPNYCCLFLRFLPSLAGFLVTELSGIPLLPERSERCYMAGRTEWAGGR
jgi:hypothetical protein